jgi:hypothetical protein
MSKITIHRDGSVSCGGCVIGFVWKVRGFSYRGVDGWNRGVRLKDFHPIHWECGREPRRSDGTWHETRKLAARWLMIHAETPSIPVQATTEEI